MKNKNYTISYNSTINKKATTTEHLAMFDEVVENITKFKIW